MPAVVFSNMPFWISIESDLTAQLIKTPSYLASDTHTKGEVVLCLFSWSCCNSVESCFTIIKLTYAIFVGVGHFLGTDWALRRLVFDVKYRHPICCYGKHTLFMKPTPKGVQCIYKPITLTLISMKAKNPVCTIWRIQARKDHNIAKLIAIQRKDHLHFKQMEVRVSMHISISQSIFLMEKILASHVQILCSIILKIPIQISGLKRGRNMLLKKSEASFLSKAWAIFSKSYFTKKSWKAGNCQLWPIMLPYRKSGNEMNSIPEY